MFLNGLIPAFIASFALLSTPQNGNYDHTASGGCFGNLQTLVFKATTNAPCYIESDYSLNGQLNWYDDQDNWSFNNIKLHFNFRYYYVSSDGSITEEFSFAYNISYNQAVLSSDFTPQWVNDVYYYGIDSDSDEFYFKWYSNNSNNEQVLMYEKREELDEAFVFSNYAQYTLDFGQLKYSCRNLVSQFRSSYDTGYDEGYSKGLSEGGSDLPTMNPEMFTIFNGILNIATIPINVLLGIFNFEVFGINISSLVSALLSVAVLVIVIRLVVGSSAKGD